MVVKKSEYQNQFRLSVLKKHQAIYLENLNLRNKRRDREFAHTPLCWEEQGGEDEVVASDSSEEDAAKSEPARKVKEPSPEYQSIAEILYNAKEKADALKNRSHEEAVCKPTVSKAVSDKHKERDALKKKSHEDVTITKPSVSKSVSDKLKEIPDVGKSSLEEKDDDYFRSGKKKDLADVDKSYSVYDIVDEENRKLNEKLARTYALLGRKFVEDISDESDTDRDMKAADKLLYDDPKMSDSNIRKKMYSKKRGKKSQSPGKKTAVISKAEKQTRPQSTGRSCSRPKSAASASPEKFVPPLSTYVPRVRRPDRRAEIPKARRRPTSSESPIKERPPFFSYGIGDIEDNLAVHRTHNVRASADQVYEHALKAKIRREEARARLERRLERAKSTDALLEKLAAASPRDLSDWESEYRKQFHGYEPAEYERAVSARSVIPRGKAAKAVQRGGCVVVHVD